MSSTNNHKSVSEKKVNPYHCDLCGMELYQLRGHDFWLGVCFNPTHEQHRFGSFPWCNPHHYESRRLTDQEVSLIEGRKRALELRLKVVRSYWELISVVHCFWSGGYNPEIDKRVTLIEGEHL